MLGLPGSYKRRSKTPNDCVGASSGHRPLMVLVVRGRLGYLATLTDHENGVGRLADVLDEVGHGSSRIMVRWCISWTTPTCGAGTSQNFD